MSGSISKFENSMFENVNETLGEIDDQLSQKDGTIRSLESKIDLLNISQQKVAEENGLLKRNVEKTIRVQGELRIANEKFKIEYDKLVKELQDRENDETRLVLQVTIYYFSIHLLFFPSFWNELNTF